MKWSWQQIAALAIVAGVYLTLKILGHEVPAEVALVNAVLVFLRAPQDEAKRVAK